MYLAVLVSVLALVALVGIGLFVFGLRRRLIQRSGGTFDCSLRWNVPEEPDPVGAPSGKGWVYGVARYSGDRIMWFRVFSYAPRPRRVLERSAIEVIGRRTPEGEEELALLSDAVVLGCLHQGVRLELAMSEDALTGFLAWLEAAPPGQRVNVA
ncbi:DUF2550 domain-containing protein [Streptomyces clavuligerus]|uniref:Putative secreted/membrane protein n=1 Tax=Streptomyces clavuligerus TaxID=1901 RepID=E2Q6P8_STRCL|nr:DUF2550 domain-containing protein [Streptomyces clavuligerus]ANW18072.1 hypothetical protein BB341_07460 [Streptomyces clavuligerus]AXU12631.1 DUF2550 family protein [Streptomyces clavuligerus]EFG09347.1 Putative secreted/membrane protein [Streptomyces clavuligerus]MBY6302533.1 DUF2550 domain-containing protein [Streptomyces clavuligerus]QCS05412.1 DUF2550 domain-containing protein [Streptomyces clavuligerus]